MRLLIDIGNSRIKWAVQDSEGLTQQQAVAHHGLTTQHVIDQILKLGLGQFYSVTETEIKGSNGTTFSFTGLASHTVESVKGFENISRVWIEEIG